MTTRVAEAYENSPAEDFSAAVPHDWLPAHVRAALTPEQPAPRPPELTPDQLEQAEGTEMRAIIILMDMFAEHDIINRPSPAKLKPAIVSLAEQNREFDTELTYLTQDRTGSGATEDIKKLAGELADVAFANVYLKRIGKHIHDGNSLDNGHRTALGEIRDSHWRGNHYDPLMGRLIKSVNADTVMAIERGNAAALKGMAEVRAIISPGFDQPANLALNKGLSAAAQILDGKDKSSDAPIDADENTGRRELVTDSEFGEISAMFQIPPKREARELLNQSIVTFEVIGAKLEGMLDRLRAEAPDDTELHDQCYKLELSLRLERARKDAWQRLDEPVPTEPTVEVFRANVDYDTGIVTGGHTEVMPEKEAEKRKLTTYVVPLVTAGLLAAGLVGVTKGDGIVDHFEHGHGTSTTEAGKDEAVATDVVGSPSPNSIDHLTTAPVAPTEQPAATPEPLQAGSAGSQQSEEYTHHTQDPQDDFDNVGQLPQAGPQIGEQPHYVNGDTLSAEDAKLYDVLKVGTLRDAVNAVVDRYTHTSNHGHNFTAAEAKYKDAVLTQALKVDRQLKASLNAQDIDLDTYLQLRANLAASYAMLDSAGVTSHVHSTVKQMTDPSTEAMQDIKDGSGLNQYKDEPSYQYVTALLANTLDTIHTAAEVPVTTTVAPSGGGTEQQQETHETGDTTLSQSEQTVLNRMESMGPEWHNRALVLRGLMERGWSLEAASGVIGNAGVEAAGVDLDPTIQQIGGGPGRGIIQWGSFVKDYDRFGHEPGAENRVGTLMWYAAQHGLKWDDLEAQIGFIDWELRNSQSAAGDALRNAQSPQAAADIIVDMYERPASPNASRMLRAHYAVETYYTFTMLSNQLAIEQSGVHTQGPQIEGDFFPDSDQIKSYLENKYGGLEDGMLQDEDLERIGDQWGDARLNPAAAQAFRLLSAEFEKEFGRPLQLSGGPQDAYRNLVTQITTYNDPDKIDERNPNTSTDDLHYGAVPGTSDHGLGLAFDLGGGINDPNSAEYKWMLVHAPDYGVVKESWAAVGGSKPEAWHWTYKGGLKVSGYESPSGNSDNSQSQGNGNANGQESYDDKNVFETPISQEGYGLPVLAQNFTIGTRYMAYSNEHDGNVHTGPDILAPHGSPALAVRAAKVIEAGYSARPGGYDADGAGNFVKILLDNDEIWIYEHLDKVTVKTGDSVPLGYMIGTVGNTGRVISQTGDGTHLHLERNEVGFTGIASHTETEEQVAGETNDPLPVLASPEVVDQYLQDHHLERVIGGMVLDATESLADVTDLSDLAEQLTDEPAPETSHTTSESEQPDHSASDHDQGNEHDHEHHDSASSFHNLHQRLGGASLHPPYNEAFEDVSH